MPNEHLDNIKVMFSKLWKGLEWCANHHPKKSLIIAAVIIFFLIFAIFPTVPRPVDPNAQYFSSWDGSNPEFVTAVKSKMNDPESFKHVETRFNDNNNGTLHLYMKFQGKNAFGGTITNEATCTFNTYDRSVSNVK